MIHTLFGRLYVNSWSCLKPWPQTCMFMSGMHNLGLTWTQNDTQSISQQI